MELKTQEWYNERTQKIISAAIEVHKELGPGLLESVYESCLECELLNRGLHVKRQMELPLIYKGEYMGESFRLDLLVDESIIVELKSVECIRDIHEVQLMSYLRLANKKIGLLINFNVPVLKAGIRRKINGYF
ncbi:GxxExxY protein [Bacteroides sp. OttesenSCG-928-D19]|nr:GxxExxY protein [Bacteroides sp. OttesenSCG-928-D19]